MKENLLKIREELGEHLVPGEDEYYSSLRPFEPSGAETQQQEHQSQQMMMWTTKLPFFLKKKSQKPVPNIEHFKNGRHRQWVVQKPQVCADTKTIKKDETNQFTVKITILPRFKGHVACNEPPGEMTFINDLYNIRFE